MPNWCYNILMVTGQPEEVEEFRIVNSQGIGAQENKADVTAGINRQFSCEKDSALERLGSRVVGNRPHANISFTCATQDKGIVAWGTKWDIHNESLHKCCDRGHWRLPHQATMSRLRQWSFDTASNPPDDWLAEVARIFQNLDFVLGYSEPGDGDFGVIYANNFEIETDTKNTDKQALNTPGAMARKMMPLHITPNALLQAIWKDNDKLVREFLKKSSLDSIDQNINSRWSALMHAAYAASERVAKTLLEAGANPLHNIKLGQGRRFGLADICFDIDSSSAAELAEKRQQIFLESMRYAPSLAKQELASLSYPIHLALNYQMDMVVNDLIKFGSLAPNGDSVFPREIIQQIIKKYEPEVAIEISNNLNNNQKNAYFSMLISEILDAAVSCKTSDDAVNLGRLFLKIQDEGWCSSKDMKASQGENPVNDDTQNSPKFVDPLFRNFLASQKAMRIINQTIESEKSRSNRLT